MYIFIKIVLWIFLAVFYDPPLCCLIIIAENALHDRNNPFYFPLLLIAWFNQPLSYL